MDIKTTIISPFPSLYKTALEVIEERAAEWIGTVNAVLLKSLGTGVIESREEIAQGTEVIVSRGNTAARIEKHIQIPVVHIQVTAVDIMQALKQVGDSCAQVGVMGFPGVVYECEKVGELMGISIRELELPAKDDVEEVHKVIKEAIDSGISVIIGDNSASSVAVKFGIQGILIESGKNAIYKAIKEAETIAIVQRTEKERAKLLNTIIESSTDGIVAVDKNGRITYFNPMAQDIFKRTAARAVGKSVGEVISNTQLIDVLKSGIPQFADIQHIGKKVIATKRIPIKVNDETVGAIASFQDVTQLQIFEQIIRQKLHHKGLVAKATLDQFIGSSQVMQTLKGRTKKFAMTDSTVLITGESGTGKEMLAQSIHNLSKRKIGPFVAINCGALPESLLESEMFGYEQGAFTGAKRGGKVGLFELAHGGTIFLDEIGEMPLPLQSRLLRVLQEKEVMRLGADRVIPIDVRVIAATNQDLETLVAAKAFRNDLYYRLNILRLCIPPLRERVEDIPELVEHFLHLYSNINPDVVGISPLAVRLLQLHSWSGNVRELYSGLERVMLLATEPVIEDGDVKEVLPIRANPSKVAALPTNGALVQMEKEAITQLLIEEEFNYSRVAARLGISRQTLWRRLKGWQNKSADQ
ncbi:MAG: sigma 54-interacting transcriptional regulator [Negativicutes bacterium]|nr:sigma 54-interacting transcriptional regulator [Negativicutes bacterium]